MKRFISLLTLVVSILIVAACAGEFNPRRRQRPRHPQPHLVADSHYDAYGAARIDTISVSNHYACI